MNTLQQMESCKKNDLIEALNQISKIKAYPISSPKVLLVSKSLRQIHRDILGIIPHQFKPLLNVEVRNNYPYYSFRQVSAFNADLSGEHLIVFATLSDMVRVKVESPAKNVKQECLPRLENIILVNENLPVEEYDLFEDKWFCIIVNEENYYRAYDWFKNARSIIGKSTKRFLKKIILVNPNKLSIDKDLRLSSKFGEIGVYVEEYSGGVKINEVLLKLDEEYHKSEISEKD